MKWPCFTCFALSMCTHVILHSLKTFGPAMRCLFRSSASLFDFLTSNRETVSFIAVFVWWDFVRKLFLKIIWLDSYTLICTNWHFPSIRRSCDKCSSMFHLKFPMLNGWNAPNNFKFLFLQKVTWAYTVFPLLPFQTKRVDLSYTLNDMSTYGAKLSVTGAACVSPHNRSTISSMNGKSC